MPEEEYLERISKGELSKGELDATLIQCDALTLFNLLAQGFRRFLLELHGLGFRVLDTAQCRVGCELHGVEELQLSSLLPEQAAALLSQVAGPDRVTPPQAQQLVASCGCNALALKLIGSFIKLQAVTAEV